MKVKSSKLRKQTTPADLEEFKKYAQDALDGKGSISFSISLEVNEYRNILRIMQGHGPTKELMTRSEATRYLIRMGWTYLQVLEDQSVTDDFKAV